MLNQIKRFLKDESGAAAIEYGLLASGISVAIIPSVKNVGTAAGQRLHHPPARGLIVQPGGRRSQAPSVTGSVSADGYCDEW